MDKQSNHNINEIKLLVLQLAQQFNKKFDEQARVIVDQRDQLESQQEQIHNQRAIIEELAWQIRDLRDSVRKCSENISNVHSKYHTSTDTTFITRNGPAENRLKLIIPDANAARQSNHRAGRKSFFFFSPHLFPSSHHPILIFFGRPNDSICSMPCFYLYPSSQYEHFPSIFDFHFPFERCTANNVIERNTIVVHSMRVRLGRRFIYIN